MNPQTILTNNLWPSWSKAIASPADPFENSPAAVERLMKKLAPYFEEVKGVRPQFHARNSTQLITFQSDTERVFYQSAWDRYLEAVSKMDQVDMKARGFMLLVQFLKFRMAAEICRSSNVASAMFDCVNKHNQAAVYACNFQHSIAKTIKFLHEIYKVPRSKISIIWGGSEAFTMKEEDYLTNKQISTILVEAMAGKAIENRILKQMTMQFRNQENNIGDVSNLDLGKQSRKDRQREIDKFQSGDSLYCFYTFKSGGVGLSLHHTDEMTEVKCHRRESGYVYEEDIPLIPTRKESRSLVQRIARLSLSKDSVEFLVLLHYLTLLKLYYFTQELSKKESRQLSQVNFDVLKRWYNREKAGKTLSWIMREGLSMTTNLNYSKKPQVMRKQKSHHKGCT